MSNQFFEKNTIFDLQEDFEMAATNASEIVVAKTILRSAIWIIKRSILISFYCVFSSLFE